MRYIVAFFLLVFLGQPMVRAQVTLFRSCQFIGTRVTLGEGSIPRLRVTSIGNDNLSSIRLNPGYSITLYQDEYFKGRSVTYSSSVSCLEYPWRSNVSSMIVFRSNGNQWGNGNGWGFNDGFVTIYRDCQYQGSSKGLQLGDYESLPFGLARNVSSIRIAQGLQAELFSGPNFTGNRALLRYDDPCFPPDWNDRVSSMRVNRLYNNQSANDGWDPWTDGGAGGSGGSINNNPSVTFFGSCDFRGSRGNYARGDYPLVSSNQITSAESIQVPSRMTIILYNQPNFRGRSITYTNDVPCLPIEVRNRVRSMKIF